VRAGGVDVGWVGDVHPRVASAWDLDRVAAFELDVDALVARAGAIPAYEDLTSFPELREDIAIVVDAGVPAARVLDVVRDAGGKLLARAAIFDVYRGEQIAEGRTSLAIALTFRARDRTLTDADVAPVRERIVTRLGEELGGELRG
jgi:phenylalanyl-tRNA synthetase beta chain